MAAKGFLLDIAKKYADETGQVITIDAAGGVEVARRVSSGEAVDAVVLAAKEIDRLIDGGSVIAGSRIDLINSPMVIVVRQGGAKPDISSERAVKDAILAAKSVGYSTGPSGVYLEQLLSRWGVDKAKRVQAPPGVPVGSLVVSGAAEIGVQQLPELIHLSGIDILGPMPPEIQLVTTFSAGVASACVQRDTVRAALAYMASPAAADARRRHGLDAV